VESSAAATGHRPVPRPLYPRADSPSERIARYKSLRGPARATALMLGAIMLIDLAAVWFGVLDLDLLQRWKDGAPVTDEELAFSDSRLVAIGSAQLVGYLMCAVVFIFWFHRAYTNVDAVESPFARRHGTGWAIGSWFVPFLNWWRPKQIANDLWAAGSPHESQREPGWLLRLWWIGLIISWVLGRIATSGAGDDETPDEFLATTKAFLVSDGFDFFVAILAILVVTRITRRMEAKAATTRERQAATDLPAEPGAPEGSEAAGGRASVAQPWTTPPTT
jgi:Domain of unknown function (DUF4328)